MPTDTPCPACGYSLAGLPLAPRARVVRCPECGGIAPVSAAGRARRLDAGTASLLGAPTAVVILAGAALYELGASPWWSTALVPALATAALCVVPFNIAALHLMSPGRQAGLVRVDTLIFGLLLGLLMLTLAALACFLYILARGLLR